MWENYGKEKFSAAVRTLATGKGRIQERLIEAFQYDLSYVKDENVPEELRDEVRELMAAATSIPGNDGRLAATISRLTEDEAVEMAKLIMSLHYELTRY
jgi:hypothetical protein